MGQDLKSAVQFFETRLASVAEALLALIIDLRWSNATLNLILNETELLATWVQHRFVDLERINITVNSNLGSNFPELKYLHVI